MAHNSRAGSASRTLQSIKLASDSVAAIRFVATSPAGGLYFFLLANIVPSALEIVVGCEEKLTLR